MQSAQPIVSAFEKGDWGAACEEVPTCKCDNPNAGLSGKNGYTCTDGGRASAKIPQNARARRGPRRRAYLRLDPTPRSSRATGGLDAKRCHLFLRLPE